MSTVSRHRINGAIQVNGVPESLFHHSLNVVIEGILDIAHAQGETVDWSTFRVEPGDKTEIRDNNGERFFYEDPLQVSVDAIKIEEGE